MKRVLVALLIRLYPSRWRAEYGPELSGVLMNRPLGVGAALNVVAGAIWQQFRGGEPWLLMGVPLLVLALQASGQWLRGLPVAEPRAGLGPSLICFGIFFTAGFWTALRRGRGSGRAAMKLNLLVCSPLLVMGALAMAGIVRLTAESARTIQGLFWGPLAQIPFAGADGWFGGLAARLVRRCRPETTA